MNGQTTRTGLRAIIVGGGVGGLCLAQGLRKAGVACTVYEEDRSPTQRRQGYRLRISPEGERALRECLAPKAMDLLVATANVRYESSLAAYDENLIRQWAPDFTDPRGDAPDKVDAVDRVILRWILLAGLDDTVRFGKRFVRYERPASGGVVVHFADGTRDTGDVLIAADGAASEVRKQCQPAAGPHDLGVRTVFSRIPMAPAIAAGMPESLQARFSYVIGSDGHHLGLMPMVFRNRPAAAAAEVWPGLPVDDADDYFMAVFNVHRDEIGMDDEAFFASGGERLRDFVLERTAGWHPDLRGVFHHADPDETFAVALRATVPIQPWESGNVVAIGDAVHAMPPSGGVGANTAVRDASALTRALVDADRSRIPLEAALARFRSDMVEYATEAVQMSLRIARWSIKKLDLPADAEGTTNGRV